MNSTASTNSAAEYRAQEFRYDSETLLEFEAELAREVGAGKEYRLKRSGSPKRRKAPKASYPGCGIAGRRNRRWSW